MTCPLNGRLWTLTVAMYHLLLHYPLVTNDQVSIIENAPAGVGSSLGKTLAHTQEPKSEERTQAPEIKKMKAKKLSGTKKAAIQDNKTQMAASADSPTCAV